jgi:hypothetical protein
MESFLHNLMPVTVLLLVALVIQLLLRVSHLENVLKRPSDTKEQSSDLIAPVNRMAVSMFRPKAEESGRLKAAGTYDALELVDRSVGHRLLKHIPALRRVLFVKIGIVLETLSEKTGITAEDLKGLESQLSINGYALFPACSMVIEEWATHTVVRDFSGQRDVIYPGQDHSYIYPTALWQYELPQRQGEWNQPYLEVVLHQHCIKFWARDGRFGRRIPPEPVPSDEHVFAVIPLDEAQLGKYRSAADEPSSVPETRLWQNPFARTYEHGTSGDGIWWDLTVNDVVSFAASQ